MKTKTIILSAMLAFTGLSSSNAAVWTVNNNTNSPGQYTGLQTAIDDIANVMDGDTLYVHGSYVSYGNITLTRPLVLIGTGFSPDKDNPLVSKLGLMGTEVVMLGSGASGSKIIGFHLSVDMSLIVADMNVNNIEISRNKFTTPISGNEAISLNPTGNSGWLINENVFIDCGLNINNASNVMITNNIITSYITTSNQSDVVISNNLFIESTGNLSVFSYVINANINNNIFYNASPGVTAPAFLLACDNCSFLNNITYNTNQDLLPYGTNTGANNIIITSTDSLFVNVTPGDFVYNETYDYHLVNISPGKNAGNDGTDIGHYGSFPPFIDSGMPAIPQIIRMNVINNVISQNDTLQINIKSRWQE